MSVVFSLIHWKLYMNRNYKLEMAEVGTDVGKAEFEEVNLQF